MPTNLLAPDDASFETSLGHWSTHNGGSISRVVTPTPHAGSGALQMTGNGSTAGRNPGIFDFWFDFSTSAVGTVDVPSLYSAVSGDKFTVSGWLQLDPGFSVSPSGSWVGFVSLQYYDSGGIYIGGTSDNPSVWVEVDSSGWVFVDHQHVVLSGTAWVGFGFQIRSSDTNEPLEADVWYVSDVSLVRTPTTRPPNDNWAQATNLGTAATGTVTGTGTGATIEAAEDGSGNSVWYGWTAPEYGLAIFTPTPPVGDMSVWTGSTLASTIEIQEVNDPYTDGELRFYAVRGVRYWIRLADVDDFSLSWTFEPFPLGRTPAAGWIAPGFIRHYTGPGPYVNLANNGPSFVFAMSSRNGDSFLPFGLPSDGDWTSVNLIIADGSSIVIGGWIFPTENEGMVTAGLVVSADAGASWRFPTNVMFHDHDIHLDPTTPDDHRFDVPYDTWAQYGAVGNGRMVVSCLIIHPDAPLDEYGGPSHFFGDQAPRVITCASSDPSTWTTVDLPVLIHPLLSNIDVGTYPFGGQPVIDMLSFAGGYFFLWVEPENDIGSTEVNRLYRSPDGLAWTEVAIPSEITELNGGSFWSIGSDGTTWLGVGRYNDGGFQNAVWSSTDAGGTWTVIAHVSHLMHVVVHDAGIWLASDDTGILWSDDDGVTWTLATGVPGHRYLDLYWDGFQWWATSGFGSGAKILNSNDGKTWTAHPTAFDSNYCVGVRRVLAYIASGGGWSVG